MNRKEEIQSEIACLQMELKNIEVSERINFNPVGVWNVTTEGDCEGRSVRQLGIHEGNILTIVKTLAPHAYYALSLHREQFSLSQKSNSAAKSGEVHFNILDDSIKLYDKRQQIAALKPHLRVGESIQESNYYGSVKLTWSE